MDDEELIDTPFDQGPTEAMLAERKYENTRNPMYLWQLIWACAGHGLPLPPVALEYLGDVAGNLLKCADSRERKAKENVQGAVFAALFGDPGKGGRSFLTQFATKERDDKIGTSMSADMLERVVPIYGENGEMPTLKTVPGASLKEAIAKARPLAPELTTDRSFSRALDAIDRPSSPHRKT